jgi:hypothetical protein
VTACQVAVGAADDHPQLLLAVAAALAVLTVVAWIIELPGRRPAPSPTATDRYARLLEDLDLIDLTALPEEDLVDLNEACANGIHAIEQERVKRLRRTLAPTVAHLHAVKNR